jgi:hypothetical protein
MKPYSIKALSRSLISIPNFTLLDVFLPYFLLILTSFYLLTAGVKSLSDVLTSNGDSVNITAGEKRVSYKTLCYKFLLISNLTHFFMYLFISCLYMFRASQRLSSGDRIVLIHRLVWLVCVTSWYAYRHTKQSLTQTNHRQDAQSTKCIKTVTLR